jgi:hypothetical protein
MFYATAITEDRMEVVFETEAATRLEALDYFEEAYPDARLVEITTKDEEQERENARYRRLEREMDY